MMLGSKEVLRRLKDSAKDKDPLVIEPIPDYDELEKGTSAASIDLRLGSWFVTPKARRNPLINVYHEQPREYDLASKYYIPFDREFILHPRHFILAVTLEWIRMPLTLAGYVNGKSSWGRYGLVIETAPGVHPGFTGCLTLEMSNIGEIPIAIKPGSRICQLFLHKVEGGVTTKADHGQMIGRRQPFMAKITQDKFELNLRNKK